MYKIPMVDLKSQYLEIKSDINERLESIFLSSKFIKGPEVSELENKLSELLNIKHIITCANGTDAIQLALMSLDLEAGDEVITPAFSYIAAAEVIKLMGLVPIYADVDEQFFDIDLTNLAKRISSKTKAIIPVHLFGQSCNMDSIVDFANKHDLIIIEDNAQSLGSAYCSKSLSGKTGSFGSIATTSFFPSKNLGCYGDGGAVLTNDDKLAEKLRMLANHGQTIKYHHKLIGINSRLDSIQAAVLNVKLEHFSKYVENRQNAASVYSDNLHQLNEIRIPLNYKNSLHIYHQYTIRVLNNKRDSLKAYLDQNGIASMIYYPIPVHKQDAYIESYGNDLHLPVSERLSKEVLSLPIHSHITNADVLTVCKCIKAFFEIN